MLTFQQTAALRSFAEQLIVEAIRQDEDGYHNDAQKMRELAHQAAFISRADVVERLIDACEAALRGGAASRDAT